MYVKCTPLSLATPFTLNRWHPSHFHITHSHTQQVYSCAQKVAALSLSHHSRSYSIGVLLCKKGGTTLTFTSLTPVSYQKRWHHSLLLPSSWLSESCWTRLVCIRSLPRTYVNYAQLSLSTPFTLYRWQHSHFHITHSTHTYTCTHV